MTTLKVYPIRGKPYNVVYPETLSTEEIHTFVDKNLKDAAFTEISCQGKLIYKGEISNDKSI